MTFADCSDQSHPRLFVDIDLLTVLPKVSERCWFDEILALPATDFRSVVVFQLLNVESLGFFIINPILTDNLLNFAFNVEFSFEINLLKQRLLNGQGINICDRQRLSANRSWGRNIFGRSADEVVGAS